MLPIERARDSLAVSEITRLYARDKDDLEGLNSDGMDPLLGGAG